jgi:hypothetical protein
MFKNFVEKFPTTNLVCQVIIVVDDGSPPNVKLQMMTEYPQFTFVFKSKQDEGLANTLNTIVQLCKTRFLLYSSDAWEPLANDDNHLHDAISILKAYPGQKNGTSCLEQSIKYIMFSGTRFVDLHQVGWMEKDFEATGWRPIEEH